MASGKDGLFGDNVGPSLYAASQGQPVKIWGFLANGRLSYFLLPADGQRTTNMTIERYVNMVERYFPKWRRSSFPKGSGGKPILIQDHERCLWPEESQRSIAEAGLQLKGDSPKSSPYLNAIEGVWKLLQEALHQNAPGRLESRAEFVVRLRRTVRQLNRNMRASMTTMCRNKKQRAEDVIKLEGARSKW